MGSKRIIVALVVCGALGCQGQASTGSPTEGSLGFDPRGTDASFEATWTINGVAADDASCATAGIDSVEIVLFAGADDVYEEGFVVASAPCGEGRYDSAGAVVAAGSYRVSIEALDADGIILGQHELDTALVVSAGDHASLGVADFETLTTLVVGLSWDADPSPDAVLPAACDEAGVATYDYTLISSSGDVVDSETGLPCEDFLFFEDIAAGAYTLEVSAADATGAVRWTATCPELSVADGAYEERACQTSGG